MGATETTCALLADDAQVVGRFELGDPVVEELDAVRFAQAIQFVEPDGPWRNRSPKSLKKSSNPPGVYTSMRRAGSGPAFHMVWGIRRGFITQQPGVALDDLVADPGVHLSLEDVEPDIVLMNVWR